MGFRNEGTQEHPSAPRRPQAGCARGAPRAPQGTSGRGMCPHLDEPAEDAEEPVLAVDCAPYAVSASHPILLAILARWRRRRIAVHDTHSGFAPEATKQARRLPAPERPERTARLPPQRLLPLEVRMTSAPPYPTRNTQLRLIALPIILTLFLRERLP